MATTQQNDEPRNQANDPAKLGADQSPEPSREDDSRDMYPVMAEDDKDRSPDYAQRPDGAPQGSAFDQQRQQGAEGDGRPNGDVGHAPGMGRAGYNGDEDRTYDANPQHGGLGSSSGREDHTDRQPDTEGNPFTGGYDGGSPDQPSPEQTKNLGLNTPSPTGE